MNSILLFPISTSAELTASDFLINDKNPNYFHKEESGGGSAHPKTRAFSPIWCGNMCRTKRFGWVQYFTSFAILTVNARGQAGDLVFK